MSENQDYSVPNRIIEYMLIEHKRRVSVDSVLFCTMLSL